MPRAHILDRLIGDTLPAIRSDADMRAFEATARYEERIAAQSTYDALKLGAARAVGVDNDPQAILATQDNASRNGVADRLAVYLPPEEPTATYPVVVANILAVALDALAEVLASRVAPGGVIALSGILKGQDEDLVRRYSAWFDDLVVTQREDWVRITGRRRAD